MGTFWRRVCVVATVLAGCSARPGEPAATFETMRASACKGDVDRFFASVDRPTLAAALGRGADDRSPQEPTVPPDAAPVVLRPGEEGVMGKGPRSEEEPSPDESAERALVGWARDVAAGKDGWVCQLKVVKVTASGDEGKVRVRGPGGDEETWTFRRSGGRWRVVGLAGH